MRKKVWQQKWRFVRNLGQGGHGRTSVVVPLAGGEEVVLKELIRQDDPERRRRMALEVAALKVLTAPPHRGIATLIESNADRYGEPEELYLIVEKISGSDLNSYVGAGTLSLDAVTSVMTQLLDTVHFCHSASVIHRDIKPDNILMREENNPVLIDFGLSFNEDARTESFASDSQQIIGNRFIALPELLVGGQDRHSFLSDITQCAGVLFFLLTGQAPVTLRDGADQPPHRRTGPRQKLQSLPPHALRKLDRIFDTAFRPDPSDRWQSIAHLRNAIEKVAVETSAEEEFDFQAELAILARAVQSSDSLKVHRKALEYCQKVQEFARVIVQEISKTVQDVCHIGMQGAIIEQHPAPSYRQSFSVNCARFPKEHPTVQVKLMLSAKQIVLLMSDPPSSGRSSVEQAPAKEYLRFHILDDDMEPQLQRAMQRCLTDFVRPCVQRFTADQ